MTPGERTVRVACRGGLHDISIVLGQDRTATFHVRAAKPVDDLAEAVLAALGAEPCRCAEVARVAATLARPSIAPEDAVELAALHVARGSPPPSYGQGCQGYWGGHHVHWIQANRSAGDPATVVRGTIVAAAGNLLGVRFPDGFRGYWHHDASALSPLVGHPADVQERWSILRVSGGRCLSITRRAEHMVACDRQSGRTS
ncbi:MAG: hypothetical protein ACRDZ3_14905 [Acidimicrobiia bacterium]